MTLKNKNRQSTYIISFYTETSASSHFLQHVYDTYLKYLLYLNTHFHLKMNIFENQRECNEPVMERKIAG